MPPRIARSAVQVVATSKGRNKNRKRNLDAFSIASHSTQPSDKIRSTRLGEVLDDGPKQKHRRVVEQDGVEDGVEEEVPVRQRPAKVLDEDVEEGSDSEGNAWTLGGLRDDDEDSDLDSDEAFGESDEERFAGFTFRGSSSRNPRTKSGRSQRNSHAQAGKNIDLDEDESGESDEDFGEEGVDLATMLDEEDEELLGKEDKTPSGMGELSAGSEDDGSSESEAESQADDLDDGDEERIARMRDRLDALDAGQQPTPSKAAPQQTALTVDDLLADLDPAARKRFAAPLKTRKKSEQPKTIAAPLPPRQQNRLNREVASKAAKEQLDRWRDTVIQNRRADFLSFPLQDPERAELTGKDAFVDDVPQNELEENIRRIMEESGMASRSAEQNAEDDLIKSEELAEKKMDIEEVASRRAELRRTRELLFREEIKAKRIAKIKSKSYRRVHRKERERMAERERGLLAERPDEEEREIADRKRAEHRVSTKHKDSKWAKSLKATNRTVWDDGARHSAQDQVRRDEELKRRIAGEEVGDDEESDGSNGSEEGQSDTDDESGTTKQLDRLQKAGQHPEGSRGIGAMKFMRAAEDRQRKQNDEDIERLRNELAVGDGDESEDNAINDQGLGRALFGPKGRELQQPEKKKRPELEEGSEDEVEEDEVQIITERPGKKDTTNKSSQSRTGQSVRQKAEAQKDHAQSDWLTAPVKGSKKDRRMKQMADVALIQTNDDGESHDVNGIKAHKATATPNASSNKAGQSANAENTNGWTKVTYEDQDDVDASDGDQNPVLTREQQNSIYHQRAFAGDNVKAAFDAEKVEIAMSDEEKEVSNHLPGWGSWAGEGLSKSVRKANNRQRHNPIYKTKLPGIKADDRKDAKLENVLISEKQDRKGKRYKADILPHEFEKKEQYERSLRVPMGPEWVTKETFQKNTRPRVVVKPGVVVGPMERPLV